MDNNPYAAPRSTVMDADVPGEALQLATKGQRLVNLFLDTIAYYIVTFVLVMVAVIVDPGLEATIQQSSFLFGILGMLMYYIPCETFLGRTPAKFLTGTRVVTETGEPPRFLQVLGRTCARFVPFEPFSCLGDPPIGWHDSWSGTRVVSTRPGGSRGPAYSLQGPLMRDGEH